MRRIVFFDAFCIFSLFALLFTVGLHVGTDRTADAGITFEIVIRPEKISGAPDGDRIALVDGKYECHVTEYGSERIILRCRGYYTEAGYLLSGAKYVSVNQPIKASQGWGYFDGRIREIRDINGDSLLRSESQTGSIWMHFFQTRTFFGKYLTKSLLFTDLFFEKVLIFILLFDIL